MLERSSLINNPFCALARFSHFRTDQVHLIDTHSWRVPMKGRSLKQLKPRLQQQPHRWVCGGLMTSTASTSPTLNREGFDGAESFFDNEPSFLAAVHVPPSDLIG
jgi:hypothetical protein